MALAAGEGTRLFPLAGETPKPTTSGVVGTSISNRTLDLFVRHYATKASRDHFQPADVLPGAYGGKARPWEAPLPSAVSSPETMVFVE
jgi:mannose-1-phosphate guanylyltransferase